MRWILVSLAPLPVVAAVLTGWLYPGAPAETVSAERVGRAGLARGAVIDGGGEGAGLSELAAYLADDHYTPPASGGDSGGDPPPFVEGAAPPAVDEAAPPPPAPPPPPPPPPDVGLVFRRQVSAVVTEPGGKLAVLLADRASGARRLRVGDRFDAEWTLISLTREAAVLSNGDRMRRVPFFGGPVTEEGASRG